MSLPPIFLSPFSLSLHGSLNISLYVSPSNLYILSLCVSLSLSMFPLYICLHISSYISVSLSLSLPLSLSVSAVSLLGYVSDFIHVRMALASD